MARKSPQDAAQKWAQRVQQSAPYYQSGVNNPSVDWAGPAVAAKDRRNAGLQAAINDGRIDAGIQRAGTGKWRAQTLAKGVTNWQQNTPKAQPQYLNGLQQVYADMQAADAAVSNMPRTTREDRIQRAATFLRTMGEQADRRKTGQ